MSSGSEPSTRSPGPAPSGSPETRVAILDAARRLLEERGYHAVAMADIAREAGVSRQAIYLHFASKAALLEALIERLTDVSTRPIFERLGVWEASSGAEALDRWVVANAESVPEILAVANAIDAARRSDSVAEATWQIPTASRYEGARRIARWLRDDGTLAPGWTVREAADFIWAQTSIRVFEDLTSKGWGRARYVRLIQRSLRDTLMGTDPAHT